jgi:hypothetical protein
MATKKTQTKSISAPAKRVHPRGLSGKRQLSHDQEFEIMKMVLDKFLWVGMGVMIYGIWRLVRYGMQGLLETIGFVVLGAVVLMLFMAVLVREFEFIE